MDERPVKALVLAAGAGKRLGSEKANLPKVMREVEGRPLLGYVLHALGFLPREATVIVVGFQKERVLESFGGYPHAVQTEQLGTGHAVMAARALLAEHDGPVLVCYGDMPLVRRDTYAGLISTHLHTAAQCTMLTAVLDDPSLAYGRVLRLPEGGFDRIIEDRDCTPEQKKITEINVGIYVFDCKWLLRSLDRLGNQNAQQEYYLTDVPALIKQDGGRVVLLQTGLPDEFLGVNTQEQLDYVAQCVKRDGLTF